MRSVRLAPDLDELVQRAAVQEGTSVSEFLRRAAHERATRTLGERAPLADVIGAVRSDQSSASRSGIAFTELIDERRREA